MKPIRWRLTDAYINAQPRRQRWMLRLGQVIDDVLARVQGHGRGHPADTETHNRACPAWSAAYLRDGRYCSVHGIDLVPPDRTVGTRRYCPKCPEGSTLGPPARPADDPNDEE